LAWHVKDNSLPLWKDSRSKQHVLRQRRRVRDLRRRRERKQSSRHRTVWLHRL